jgi:hypothetical protein
MDYRVHWFILSALMLLNACAALDTGSTPRKQTSTLSKQEPRIELAIRDDKFIVVEADATIGRPMVITVRNEDAVTRGFFPTFNGQAIQAEGERARVLESVEGFHVDPGESLTIRFTPEQAGAIRFQCDPHSHTKDEQMYIDARPTRHR